MPTTLARKDRVASHLWRDRRVARSAARGRRTPGLDAPVRDPPVLGTPVLGPPVSGASLASVLSAGVLRLAPRPPVVVTPLPRSHGDRSHRPRRYGPLTRRAHASLELPPRRGPAVRHVTVGVSKQTARLRATQTRTHFAIPAKEVEKTTKPWRLTPHPWRPSPPTGLRSGAAARARRCLAPDAAGASYRRPARRDPPGLCSPHRPRRARSSRRASAPALPRR